MSSTVPVVNAAGKSKGEELVKVEELVRVENDPQPEPRQLASQSMAIFIQASAAIFYGLASFLIVVIIKSVLTNNNFPASQFVGLGQMVATLIILRVCKMVGVVRFPDFDTSIFRRIWPLPAIYLGNLMFGLSSTKSLNLPMFTVLRRFSILMTLVGEEYLLRYRSSMRVRFSVVLMIGGALIAALSDLAFNLHAYIVVFLNDLCTAGNGVYMKQKLEAKDLGKYGVMYYNALFMILPSAFVAWMMGDLDRALEYPHWNNWSFVIQFVLACVMGFVLILSTVICTSVNSALTTTIVGCLKNIFVTYVGMAFGGDYIFSFINFIGLNVSVAGGVIYALVKYREQHI
jgi:solute carrier family 35 protein